MSSRIKVFISYSHEDEYWLKRLRIHLKPLEQYYDIDIWDDRKIKAGSNWREEIKKAVSSAKVAVLLVSASFHASDFIATDELPPLLDAAEQNGATILPVIVSACRFLKSNLSQFQAVNDPSTPLINMSKGEQEATFEKVAEATEAALQPPPKTHTSLSEKDSLKDTILPTSQDDNSSAKKDFRLEPTPFYKQYKYLLIIGMIVILSVIAWLIALMNGKLPTVNLPGVLIVLGIIVAIFIWLPFRISVKWFTLTPPRQFHYRLLVFILGILILAFGVYFKKSALSEPTLRSYVAYVTLDPLRNPTGTANCLVTYHVVLRFEVPEGQQAVYQDRIKARGGGTEIDSNPSAELLNRNQWPGDPNLLEFKIQEKQQSGSRLDIEAVAFEETLVTPEHAKIGPHLPYRTEYVVVIVDYSRMGFTPPGTIRGEVETLGPSGESQTETLALVPHPKVQDGTATLVARNLPAKSDILLRWGTEQ